MARPGPAEFAIQALPLTAERFAPFGEVIAAAGGRAMPVNDGRAVRHDGLARLAHATGESLPVLATYRVEPSRLPLTIEVLERHPHSSQVFLPMGTGRYLVGVALEASDDGPDLARLQAFIAEGPMGLHYRAGVWHVPMTALDEEAVFAMLMWETGVDDTVEHRLSAPVIIHD